MINEQLVTRNGKKGFLDDKGNFYPIADMPTDDAKVTPSSAADQSGGLGAPDVPTTSTPRTTTRTTSPTSADRVKGDRAISQGGGRTGEAYVGTGEISPTIKRQSTPASKPVPTVRTNKDNSDVTRVGPNKSGLTPMQQWAKNFPKLAAKVKPGQSGYAEINPTTTKSTPIRLPVQPFNPGKVSTGGYDPRGGSYAQQLNTTLKNLSSDYGRLPQGTIKPVSKRQMKKEAYDVVLDYLLSEGHVDTVEEAHYVMLQMTSEHVRDIVEGAGYSNPSIGGKPILNPKGHPQEGKPASFNKAETEGVDRYKRARKETGKKLPVDGPLPPGY